MRYMEKRWVIVGKYGLYVGQWLLRRDAIREHTKMIGQSWRRCYRRGDRVVKAEIYFK
jgi:hypothetical protein